MMMSKNLIFTVLIIFLFSVRVVSGLSINITKLYPQIVTQNTNVSLSLCFIENNYVDYLRGWLKTNDKCIELDKYNIYISSFSGIYCLLLTSFIKNCSSGIYYISLETYVDYPNYNKTITSSYIYPIYISNPPKIVLEYNYSEIIQGKINKAKIKIKNYGDAIKDVKLSFNQSNCPIVSSEIYLNYLSNEFSDTIYFKVPLNTFYCTIPIIISYKDMLDNSYIETKIINLPADAYIPTITINYDIPLLKSGEDGKIILELYNPTKDILRDLTIFISSTSVIPKKNYIYIEKLNPYERKKIEIDFYVPSNLGGEIIIPINMSYIDSSGKLNIVYNPVMVRILERSELKFSISEIYGNRVGLDVINFGNCKINSLILKINCDNCLINPNIFYIGGLDVGESSTVYFDVMNLENKQIKILADYLTSYGNSIQKEYNIVLPELNISISQSILKRDNQTTRIRVPLSSTSNILIYITIIFILIITIVGLAVWKIFKKFGKE